VSGPWIAVVAAVLLVGVPVALAGLYATGDLCDPPYGSRDSRLAYERYENVVETVVVRCTAVYRDGTQLEETRINWIGSSAALLFLIGAFFGIAGVFRAMPLKRAAAVTGMCATICFALVVIWFAWA
jgi:hypothetical protein